MMTGRGTTTPRAPRSRPGAVGYAAAALEGVVAVAGYGGGVAMLAAPDGALIRLPPEMLDRLPVDSWLLPGAALVACNGVLPTSVAVAELRGRQWPRRFGHLAAGVVLLAWPVTETLIYGYPLAGEPRWLRPVVGAAGVTLIGLGVRMRRRQTSGGISPRR